MKDFLNKIPKETLTAQNIREELRKKYKKSFCRFVMPTLLAIILVIIAIKMDFRYDLQYIIFLVLVIASLLIATIFLVDYIKSFVELNNKITIVTDWLVDIREDVDLRDGHYHRNLQYTDLTFAKYGRFRLYTDIYGDTNYTWSKMYAMSNQGVCNYSNINDEFYLVISNDKNPHILQIYNQKLFELK